MDAGVVVTVKTIERFWQMALKNAKDCDKPAEPGTVLSDLLRLY